MPDNDPDLMAQFQEFLNAKAAKEAEDAQSEDFEVEIWDKDGRGVRTKRSHAKPFLQSLGIDIDPEPEGDNSGDKGDGGTKTKRPAGRSATGSASNATGTQSTVRKYFAPNPAKK
jgi:hypothetical protein